MSVHCCMLCHVGFHIFEMADPYFFSGRNLKSAYISSFNCVFNLVCTRWENFIRIGNLEMKSFIAGHDIISRTTRMMHGHCCTIVRQFLRPYPRAISCFFFSYGNINFRLPPPHDLLFIHLFST